MPSVLLRKSKRSLLALSAEAADDVVEQKPAVAPKPKKTLANTQPSAEERALEDALFGKSSRFLSAAPAETDGEVCLSSCIRTRSLCRIAWRLLYRA